jgi:hypothetical protein
VSSFDNMVKNLIKQGLLTANRELTLAGHEYVEQIKKKYDTNVKPFSYGNEGEQDDGSTSQPD